MIIKFDHKDRYDSLKFGEKDFIHCNSYISCYSENFHKDDGFIVHTGSSRRSHRFGINKKEFRASSHGINIDSEYIGKSK